MTASLALAECARLCLQDAMRDTSRGHLPWPGGQPRTPVVASCPPSCPVPQSITRSPQLADARAGTGRHCTGSGAFEACNLRIGTAASSSAHCSRPSLHGERSSHTVRVSFDGTASQSRSQSWRRFRRGGGAACEQIPARVWPLASPLHGHFSI